MADPNAVAALEKLVDIMTRLRAPGGCPWDREQTPASLRPYLIEETYEVLEAIEHGSAAERCDELGDLLLQVVFQAEMAAEAGDFTIADVARAISDKLVRRHPHVFGDVTVRDADEVMRNWHEIKAAERRDAGTDTSALAGVPSALPALARAQKIGQKAARVGFDWPDVQGVFAKVREEQIELEEAVAAGDLDAARRELGDALLTLVSVARHLDVPAEMALRDATDRFQVRFHHCEGAARDQGTTLAAMTDADRDRLWNDAKAKV